MFKHAKCYNVNIPVTQFSNNRTRKRLSFLSKTLGPSRYFKDKKITRSPRKTRYERVRERQRKILEYAKD